MTAVSQYASRTSSLLAVCAAVALSMSTASPATALDLNISIGEGNTSYVVVPGTRVYIVEDGGYDIYRYGTRYYVTDGERWYRRSGTAGPFRSINARYLPREVSRGREVRKHDRSYDKGERMEGNPGKGHGMGHGGGHKDHDS